MGSRTTPGSCLHQGGKTRKKKKRTRVRTREAANSPTSSSEFYSERGVRIGGHITREPPKDVRLKGDHKQMSLFKLLTSVIGGRNCRQNCVVGVILLRKLLKRVEGPSGNSPKDFRLLMPSQPGKKGQGNLLAGRKFPGKGKAGRVKRGKWSEREGKRAIKIKLQRP